MFVKNILLISLLSCNLMYASDYKPDKYEYNAVKAQQVVSDLQTRYPNCLTAQNWTNQQSRTLLFVVYVSVFDHILDPASEQGRLLAEECKREYNKITGVDLPRKQ